MSEVLATFGLTTATVRRFVVAVASPVDLAEVKREKQRLNQRRFYANHREEFLAAGKTTRGTPLQIKRRPELAGLSRPEYHRRHMALWRAEKKS